jgi:hypothetical protein
VLQGVSTFGMTFLRAFFLGFATTVFFLTDFFLVASFLMGFFLVAGFLAFVGNVVDSYLLLNHLHLFLLSSASLGSLATILAPSSTHPHSTTPYCRHAPPAPQ